MSTEFKHTDDGATQAIQFAIVTATYNRPDLLKRCAASIQAQTYPHWQWVIINDGSLVDYSSVAGEFNDDRIRYECLDRNVGVLKARNVALDRATALDVEFILFLDDDDMLTPDCLSEAAAVIRQHPEFQWFLSDVRKLDRPRDDDDVRTVNHPIPRAGPADYVNDIVLERTLSSDKNMIIGRDAIGPLRLRGVGGEFWTLLLQIARKHRIWVYPHVSKIIDYQKDGLTGTSLFPRDYAFRVFIPIRKTTMLLWMRPGHRRAWQLFTRQFLLLPLRVLQYLSIVAGSVLSKRKS